MEKEPTEDRARRGGRASRYGELVAMLPDVRAMLEGGMTEKEAADEAGFAWSTWSRYKRVHPEFAEFVRGCRAKPAEEVKGALYRSALGHTVKVRKAMKLKTVEYEGGKRSREHEDLVEYTEDVYFPPNVTAGIFLLTNWLPGEYARDARAAQLREREISLKEQRAEDGDWS
ncbi:hypothetical protein [Raoultibacter timonensis]|uniref:hypothetical protein n=1 Tax=Raoultibacter timonensis TaxID=1907662 RepID=UPI0026DA909A|nr:hypothetical protein [Raoultibacter timonensis]